MQAGSGTDLRPSATQAQAREQLRVLYLSLLMRQERFDEFKQLLATYPLPPEGSLHETAEGAAIRGRLNERISQWIGATFAGLAPEDILVWRAALVEQQANAPPPGTGTSPS